MKDKHKMAHNEHFPDKSGSSVVLKNVHNFSYFCKKKKSNKIIKSYLEENDSSVVALLLYNILKPLFTPLNYPVTYKCFLARCKASYFVSVEKATAVAAG